MAAGAVTLFQPNLVDALENAAQIVSSDLERARNLAVSNNSQYKITFNADGSGYYLQHSGSNTSLNTLPSWPYKQRTDPSDRQTTLLKKLPGLDDVELIGIAQVVSSNRQKVSDVTFTSLGATSRTQATEVWLAAGVGDARRYLAVTVNATTGLANVGDVLGTAPTISP